MVYRLRLPFCNGIRAVSYTHLDVYKRQLYPCVVISDDGEELEYVLSDEFGTQGASGAPLLNDKGEVVGIHIGSDGSHRYGHSAQSMKAQLKNAMEN